MDLTVVQLANETLQITDVSGPTVVVSQPQTTLTVNGVSDADKTVEVFTGAPGLGVPKGGTTGQYLIKLSNADYDFGFAAGGGGGGGGTSTITSVNGYTTGVINLTATDVGAKPSSYVPTWAELTGKPTTFTPSVHTHAIGDTTNLQTTLDSKAPTANPTFTGTVAGVTKSMVGLANVDNTADTAKPVSTAQQTALNLKAPIASPTFTGTVSGVTKTMVGLGNVDNTADTAKPVSTAQQTALDLKAPIASPTFTGTVSGITKTMVGLSNVDNTADTAKPVSTAQQTALAAIDTPPLTTYIASSTATAAEKARADYVCDATDDNVQIQAAVDAMAPLGGTVLLSPGVFFISTPVLLTGANSQFTHKRVVIKGAGQKSTFLRPLYNVSSALHLSQYMQVDISDIGFYCYGSSTGITSAADNASNVSFYLSTFKNLYFNGSSDGGSTGYGMNLVNPWRSVFENIEIAGFVNGIRLYSNSTNFFSGNCSFNRVFVYSYGSNGVAFKLDAVAGGILNAITFNMCEGLADGGTGNTAVYLGGAGQVNHTRWIATNFEQYDTIFRVNNGVGNTIDGTYWDVRNGAAANTTQLVQYDTNAKGNRVIGVTGHYAALTTKLVVSTAVSTVMPNSVENVSLVVDTGGTVTNTVGTVGTVNFKNITAEGAAAANAASVVVAPPETQLRGTDANAFYNTGSSSYPLRSTITNDANRRVRWIGPTAPQIGGGYATTNFDVWEQTA